VKEREGRRSELCVKKRRLPFGLFKIVGQKYNALVIWPFFVEEE